MFGEVARLVGRARRILFITGAGISADSGLPTYRGIGGLYEDRGTIDGLSIEGALSGAVFRVRPDITWKYLAQIESNCRGAHPNRAHEVIAELERERPFVMVLTQNVDGFHREAGSQRVLEIHGNLRQLRCTRCRHLEQVPDYGQLVLPPICPQCGAAVRPRVVLFGESLPVRELLELQTALAEGFDLVFSVGTSSVFPYIVEPVLLAKAQGRPTVEINPGETPVSGMVDYRFGMGAAEAMDRLWQEYAALRAV